MAKRNKKPKTRNFLIHFEDETIIPVNGRYCFGFEEATLNGCR